MALTKPTADFVTSTLSGALAAGATTATIGTGLSLPATNGVLHIDYDSTTAVGSENGPETVTYATYTTATGALAGLVRGAAGTTDVAHANGATVSAGISVEHLNSYDRKNTSDQTIIGKNDVRATRFVPVVPGVELLNADPANTNWTDIDVTAQTSARCFAVAITCSLSCGATARGMYVRQKGDTTEGAIPSAVTAVRGLANSTLVNSLIIGVDSDNIFQWSVTNADVTNAGIHILGYFEYVD